MALTFKNGKKLRVTSKDAIKASMLADAKNDRFERLANDAPPASSVAETIVFGELYSRGEKQVWVTKLGGLEKNLDYLVGTYELAKYFVVSDMKRVANLPLKWPLMWGRRSTEPQPEAPSVPGRMSMKTYRRHARGGTARILPTSNDENLMDLALISGPMLAGEVIIINCDVNSNIGFASQGEHKPSPIRGTSILDFSLGKKKVTSVD
jgi:hypothetical protein